MKNSCLIEAKPMELVCPVPTIHFKPVENKKKPAKGMTRKQIKHAQRTEKYTVKPTLVTTSIKQ